MSVTEFALLRLTPNRTLQPILPILAAAMHDQDQWHLTHYPQLTSSAPDRAAFWFVQVEDPSVVMTTAKWESVAAHWAWIHSDENKTIMAALGEYIVAGDTVLMHIAGDIFGGGGGGGGDSSGEGSIPLVKSDVISMERMFVEREKREAFTAKFEEIRGDWEKCVSPRVVRFGWREDVEDGAKQDEFVLVCGWGSVDERSRVIDEKEFGRYNEISELAARVDLKFYRRFLVK